MKNLFILTVFALIALTSCKKDYTCECKSYEDGELVGTETDAIKATKSKAIEICDEGDGVEINFYTGFNEVECEIK